MAIEAARQRSVEKGLTICGFDLRQIYFSQALVIPEPSGQVETMFCMKQYPESAKSSSSSWDEFFVYSASEQGEWVEHCRGHISARRSNMINFVDGQSQKEKAEHEHQRQKAEADLVCKKSIEGSVLYLQLADIGLDYGRSFANLATARVEDGHQGAPSSKTRKAIGTVIHPDIEKVMPSNHQSLSVIHPTILDAFFHVAIAAPNQIKSAAVPTFISSVFVSGNFSTLPHHEFFVYAQIDEADNQNPNITLNVYDFGSNDAMPSV